MRQVDLMVELVEPKSESPMETRVRLLLVLSGLPPPSAQLIIRDRAGRIIARADLGYEAARLLVEYDGALHWEQRRADDRRRDLLRELGWEIVVVSSEDYYRTPELIVSRVRAALSKQGI